MTIPSVRLVAGHPDDANAEAAALSALRAKDPPYTTDWPREIALRYLNALGDESRVRIATPPSDKELTAFLRGPLSAQVTVALSLFEAVLGTDRVAAEIVSLFERAGIDDKGVLVDALGAFRERLPTSERSRLDARLRILTRTSAAPAIETMLTTPRVSKRPPKPATVEVPPPEKKPAKKKAKKK